jgi:hypothetical protein
LPSREELVALYHAIQGGHPFTGVRGWYYLSGTHHVHGPRMPLGTAVAIVSMGSGNVSSAYTTDFYRNKVWPVRAGQ